MKSKLVLKRVIYAVFVISVLFSGAPVVSAEDSVRDKRLDQIVSVRGVQLRLFQIADELTKQTKVTVRIGRDSKDWPIRDIPVTIAVKNIPLGELLKALSYTTHTRLVKEPIKTDQGVKYIYRIYRDVKLRLAVENYNNQLIKDNLVWQNQMWDKLIEITKLPDSSWHDYPYSTKYDPSPDSIRAIAAILASADPSVKERVMNGEGVIFNAKNCDPKLLSRFYQAAWRETIPRATPASEPLPQMDSEASNPQNHFLAISPSYDENGVMSVSVGMPQMRLSKDNWFPYSHVLGTVAQVGLLSTNKPGTKPDFSRSLSHKLPTEEEHKGYKLFDNLSEEEWKKLGLNLPVKFTLEMKAPSIGDRLIGMAEAANINVVFEDFDSQVRNIFHNGPVEFYDLFTGLQSMNQVSSVYKLESLLPDRIVIGTLADWDQRHRNLMPYGIRQQLIKLGDTTGIEIDEIALLSFYPSREWTHRTVDLDYVAGGQLAPEAVGFWKIYASLTPEDKITAKSDKGLALYKFDANWLSEMAKNTPQASIWRDFDLGEMVRHLQAASANRSKIADPGQISKMTLKVSVRPYKPHSSFAKSTDEQIMTWAVSDHRYTLTVTDEDGKTVVEDKVSDPFPIYSPKKARQILNPEKTSETKPNQPKP